MDNPIYIIGAIIVFYGFFTQEVDKKRDKERVKKGQPEEGVDMTGSLFGLILMSIAIYQMFFS